MRLVALLVCALALAGCALPGQTGAGPDCRVCRFTELRPGISTVTDAIALLGTPNGVAQSRDGGSIMTWVEAPAPEHMLTVLLIFDAGGRFQRVGSLVRV